MKVMPQQADVLAKVVAWANDRPMIRAVIMTSSRVRPGGPVDLLSDYDIILVVTEAERFGQDSSWLSDYGRPMVTWGDQSELYGVRTYFRGVLYKDYIKIDYGIWPDALLEIVATQAVLPDELDVGYRVLLDKDNRTAGWKPPSYRAHIPAPPTEAEFHAVVEEFWWTSTYVAKSLWRDELVIAKFCLDYEIKLGVMRRMLEWRLEIDHNWSVKPGVQGRGLKRLLPGPIWLELAATYAGPDIEANWEALSRTTALFRRVSIEVSAALGFHYPSQLDEAVSAYLNEVRSLPPGPTLKVWHPTVVRSGG